VTSGRRARVKTGHKAKRAAGVAVASLIAAGADLSIQDKKGLTAAQSAAGTGPLGALAALLDERPQDVAEGEAGKRALRKISLRGARGQAMAEQNEFRGVVAAARHGLSAEEAEGDEGQGKGGPPTG
jgi:hypothetical protein